MACYRNYKVLFHLISFKVTRAAKCAKREFVVSSFELNDDRSGLLNLFGNVNDLVMTHGVKYLFADSESHMEVLNGLTIDCKLQDAKTHILPQKPSSRKGREDRQ